MADRSDLNADLLAIMSRERRSVWISAIVAILLVGGGVLFLLYTASEVRDARAELSAVTTELEKSSAALADTRAKLTESAAQLAAAQEARAAAAAAATQSQAEVERAKSEIAALRAELSDAERQLADLTEQIRLSVNYKQHLHPIGWEDAKILSGSSDSIGDLIGRILNLQDSGLKFSIANTPEKGFTSPAFAEYVLKQMGLLDRLSQLPTATAPKLGDIVRYEGGFALFYFEDSGGKPFVMGMTPVGIAALDLDFGVKQTGVLSTGILAPR